MDRGRVVIVITTVAELILIGVWIWTMRLEIRSRKAFAECLREERTALLRCIQTSARTNQLLEDVMTLQGRSPTAEEWESLATAIDAYDFGPLPEEDGDEFRDITRERTAAVLKAARACLVAHIVDLHERTQAREGVQ